jgi:Zn-dependent M28 family amino/carboxypeptidase
VSLACAKDLLGKDVEALADKIDRSARPVRVAGGSKGTRSVRLRSRTRESSVDIENVVGLLRGSDATLSSQYVVVGAHYDHVGIDARGRIACGADDNASGVAGMLEIAEALAAAGPRRSVLFCAFAAEEDGLLGSKAFCGDLPVPRESLVAMINLDMIGRGDASEVAVLGLVQNPALEKVVTRARKLKPSGLREVVMRQGEELFERSDHFSFHGIGVPTLFFFEGLPIDKNRDYHTWRDTVDKLDMGKMLNTTRFVYNATWILTDDDDRPPPPQP